MGLHQLKQLCVFSFICLAARLANTFQFKSPDVSADPLTISVTATYQFTLLRQWSSNSSSTAYLTEAVPSGSNITITFPSEFTLVGSETCSFIMIDGTFISGFSSSVNTASRTLTVSGAVTSNQFIAIVILQINGVTNPSSALTSSPFTAKIGSDYSATNSASAVVFQPGELTSVTVAFDTTTVNTTSNMIVTIVNAHAIPSAGQVTVKFPSSLRWSREIYSGHTLPITSSMSCSAIQNTHYTISCTGDNATGIVTAKNIFNSPIAAGTTIKFTINNLFTPPTMEPNLDGVVVTTYDASSGTAYKIDELTGYVSGLSAKTTSLAISSAATLAINSKATLIFTFTLPDSISRNDYVVIDFPIGSTVSNISRYSAQLNISTFSYNSTTCDITIEQSSSSTVRLQGTVISITFLQYVVPPSAKTTGLIYLNILNNGYQKMTSSSTLTPVAKNYSGTVSADDLTINSDTTYRINFALADSLSATAYMDITLPPELEISSQLEVVLSGSSIASTPLSIIAGSHLITIKNLNLTATGNITAQNINITLKGITQPSSVRQISNFVVKIYYSSSSDLVATLTTTNAISLTPGLIQNTVISSSSLVTAASSNYTFSVTIRDALDSGSTFSVVVPPEISIGSGTCLVQAVAASCTLSNQTITFQTASAYTASTTVVLTYTLVNPASTAPTSTFNISTFDSASRLVNILNTTLQSTLTVSMKTPSTLLNPTLTRSSTQNSKTTFYTFSFEQPQAITVASAAFVFLLPEEIGVDTTQLACTNASSSATLPCSYNMVNNSIAVYVTASSAASTTYSIRLAGITNPYSLAPTSASASILTKTSDLLYSYSEVSSGLKITNTIPSSFSGLTFDFSNKQLSASTNLSLNFTTQGLPENQSVSYFEILFASSFSVGSSSTITCQSPDFTPICSLQQNTNNSRYQLKVQSGTLIPDSFTLTLGSLQTPSNIPTDYTSVTSYDSSGYKISLSQNLVIFTTYCTFPCKSCPEGSKTVCTACYSSAITTKVYLFNQTCLSTCPSTYYEDSLDLVCKACKSPCLECEGASTYCTYCDPNSSYIYLNVTNTTSTCLTACPTYMYPDTTQLPSVCTTCVSPCLKCFNQSACETCIPNYFLYGQACLASCPVEVTIVSGDKCIDCSQECAGCSITPSNCTSCSSMAALYQGTCVFECPGALIIVNQECVACDPECATCHSDTSNCTSCFTGSALPYYYENQCLDVCPNFYYTDTFKKCQSCAILGIGCKNCSSPTACLSCDPGLVLLTNNCLDYVPDGYLNISGVAVPCEGDCETCSVTLTNCTSCKTLNLFQTTCLATCPSGTISIDQVCVSCVYPCETCVISTSKCTSCADNSSLFLSNFECVDESLCPATTYPNYINMTCSACVAPCLNCESLDECSSCIAGYFLLSNASSCGTTCPAGMVGVNRVCLDCQSPCKDCTVSTTRCTSCEATFFYNQNTNECLTECPVGLIENYTLMACVACESPCKTCEDTIDTCLSCVNGTFLSGTQCVAVCPEGEYGVSGICTECINNCSTCTSATACLSCIYPLVLFSQKCIEECPETHSIVSNDSVCISCQTVVTGCSNCSIDGDCYDCFSPRIYFNGQCLTSCPSGYTLVSFECEVTNATEKTLSQTLSSSEVFPLPFTILGGIFFIACCMSKLQNHNTYLIGSLYSLMGLVETGSIAYLIYRYYSIGPDYYDRNYLLVLVGALGVIYVLNLFSFFIQTMLLLYDPKFAQWLRACGHKSFYSFVVIVSLLLNYKFKMIVFTRLFKFSSMSAHLESVSKFRMFNIYSFFGLIAEAMALFACFLLVFDFLTVLILLYAFLDVIIICIINIILAILISWKPDSFFHEEDGDYTLNKKINAEGEDYSKEAIEPGVDYSDFKKSYIDGDESYSVLHAKPIDEEDLQESFIEEEESMDKQKNTKTRPKIYFANEDSSNPFRREPESREPAPFDRSRQPAPFNHSGEPAADDNITPNIFSNFSPAGDEEEPAHQSEYYEGHSNDFDVSSAGGSEIVASSPLRKEGMGKEVVYAVESKVSQRATDNEDIKQKISAREEELDQIRKDMDEKKQKRRQEKKQDKKNKKSLESIEVPIRSPGRSTVKPSPSPSPSPSPPPSPPPSLHEDPEDHLSYEELTIQDSSHNDKTQEETDTIEGNVANDKVFLEEERRQEEIQDQSKYPKGTIGSWIGYGEQGEGRESPDEYQKYRTLSMDHNSNNDIVINNKSSQPPELHQQNEQRSIEGELKDLNSRSPNNKQLLRDKAMADMAEFEESNKDLEDDKAIRLQLSPNRGGQRDIQYSQNLEQDVTISNSKQVNNEKQSEQKQTSRRQRAQLFKFQDEDSKDLQGGGNTKMNFYNNVQDSGLDDSHHEDERINERPLSGARRQGLNKNEALVDILERVEKDRQRIRKSLSKSKMNGQLRNSKYEKSAAVQSGGFKYSGPNRIQGGEDFGDETRRSRIYTAGLHQIDRDHLTKKHSLNHPLASKRRTSQEQSEFDSSINDLNKSRNQSFNHPAIKKYTSKDISMEKLDEIEFSKLSIKGDYSQLLNERVGHDTSERYQTSAKGAISASKIHRPHQSAKKPTGQPFRKGNFAREASLEDDSLKEYYQKEEKKSRKKELSRERSLEDTKRLKHLERIYLASPKK